MSDGQHLTYEWAVATDNGLGGWTEYGVYASEADARAEAAFLHESEHVTPRKAVLISRRLVGGWETVEVLNV
jgi:hypothetical protein